MPSQVKQILSIFLDEEGHFEPRSSVGIGGRRGRRVGFSGSHVAESVSTGFRLKASLIVGINKYVNRI